MAGMIAKYFATSLAMEKVVSAPRVISNCLPMPTISISFVGSLSRSTMLPASRAAGVPVFMATPTSACASAGASLVPSPHMATSLPLACSLRMSVSLASGVACARKSSTPASAAMAAAVSGLSPVIITVQAHAAQFGEPLANAAFHDVLQVDDAERAAILRHGQRRTAASAYGVGEVAQLGRGLMFQERDDGVHRALADDMAVDVDAAHAGLRAERNEFGPEACEIAFAKTVFLLGENHDGAPLRRFVRERGELGGFNQFPVFDAGKRDHVGCHAIAERDRSGLVE